MSIAFSGKNNPMFGRKRPEMAEHAHKMSQNNIGRKSSEQTKQKISEANLGEKHPRRKLNWDIVNLIRSEYATEEISYETLSKKYDVSFAQIGRIIRNENWIKK